MLRHKWLLTGKMLAAYCILAPATIWLFYLSGNFDLEKIKIAQKEYFSLFNFSQFWYFLKDEVWEGPLLEETLYRSPIWLLAVGGIASRVERSKLNLFWVWLVIIIPNIHWTTTHFVFDWVVFVAGLGWGWLVYKTGSLWPAIISHAAANLLIYFGIKFAELFIKI